MMADTDDGGLARSSAFPFGKCAGYAARSVILRNPHAQIVIAEVAMPRRVGGSHPETVVDLEFRGGASTRLVVVDPSAPPRGVLLLVHGLGGAADGPRARWLAESAAGRGWRAVSVDLRGAGGTRRQPRLYTAADLDELDLASAHPTVTGVAGPKIAVGLSLGGGILLRWLGMRGGAVKVDAAVAIAPTAHLPSCALALGRLRHRLYDLSFAWALGRRIRAVAASSGRKPHAFLTHFTMRRLDDDFASLACGVPDAAGYWEHASAHHHLGGIDRPVLVIAAEDDPFVPFEPLRTCLAASPLVDLRAFPHGGHLSFLERSGGRFRSRLPELMLDPLDPLA
jgi:predicted alpha/beta-fold hydrolase